MKNKFICKIDNAIFETEEETLKHIKEKYVDQVNENSNYEIAKTLNLFETNFPKAKAEIKNNEDYGGHRVVLDFLDYKLTCDIGKGEHDFYLPRFEHPESAVNYFKKFFVDADEIIERVRLKYNPYHFSLYFMEEGGGDSDATIGFKLITHEGGKEYKEFYYPYTDRTIEDFIDSLKYHFTNNIEGKVRIEHDRHWVHLYIGNVNVKDIMERAKYVKLEIIE